MAYNTTTYTGEAGRVEFDVSDSLTNVASVRSFSIDLNTETIEDTNMSSGGVRSYKAGLTDFSGTMDLFMRDSDAAQQALRTQGSAPATLKLYPSGETAGMTLTGEVIITGFSITSTFDGMVEATCSFQGTNNGSGTGLTIAAT
jgi:predicted secreted protein